MPMLLPNGRTIFSTTTDDGRSTGNLRIKQNGTVDFEGGRGPWAQFLIESADSAGSTTAAAHTSVRIKSAGHQERHARDLYLNATPEGLVASNEPGGVFALVPASAATHPDTEADGPMAPPGYVLSDEQKQTFMRDGVLVLRGLVPPLLVDEALRAINARLGAGSGAWGRDESGEESLDYAGLGRSPALTNLLARSPAIGVAESLLGRLRRAHRPSAQIALRFPLDPDRAHAVPPKGDGQWHIDGMRKDSSMSPFQLLLGVALSSQPNDDCGNLHVWPGEHRRTFEAVRAMRATRLAEPARTRAGSESEDVWLGHRPAMLHEGCQQVHLEPGDVVLAHQKTPHRIGLNRSPHIRYQAYFRLSAEDYEPDAPMRSLFDGWHGLRDMGEVAKSGVCPMTEAW